MSSHSTEIRAVVFDLDGTLIDSMPMVLRAFQHALAPFCPPMSDAELFLRLGGPPMRTLEEFVGDPANVRVAAQRLQEFGRENLGLVAEFAGMREVLALVRARGLTTSLWTGRDRSSAELMLSRLNLAGEFKAIVCGDDFSTHKPDPEGLLSILAAQRLAADEVLFVGDADVDVLAGHEAGVRTILIAHKREISDHVRSRAWRVVETPAEAYRLVDEALPRQTVRERGASRML